MEILPYSSGIGALLGKSKHVLNKTSIPSVHDLLSESECILYMCKTNFNIVNFLTVIFQRTFLDIKNYSRNNSFEPSKIFGSLITGLPQILLYFYPRPCVPVDPVFNSVILLCSIDVCGSSDIIVIDIFVVTTKTKIIVEHKQYL